MEKIDRRWIYLMVAVAVVLPFIFPADLPISITPEAQMLYDAVEAVPDGANVMLVFDYYPSTIAECEPMAITALHHFFRKNCKVITLSNIPLGGVIRFAISAPAGIGSGIAGVPASKVLSNFMTPVRRVINGINTGVAIRNVGDGEVTLNLSLRNEGGAEPQNGSLDKTVPGNGKSFRRGEANVN